MTEDAIEFHLDDGTKVLVPLDELRPVYEALWDLSDVPGAISTAALLIDEGHKLAKYR